TVASRLWAGAALAAATVLLTAPLARAGASPEGKCQERRYKAAARYASCEAKVLANLFGASSFDLQRAFSKCRVKYTGNWDKLVAKGAGSMTCVGDRFVDNVDGTVSDKLTALQGEKTTN